MNLKHLFLIFLISFVTSCSTFKNFINGHNLPLVHGISSESQSQHEDQSRNVMITTQCPYATEAGLEILRRGGNLFDAAITISFVLSVSRPQSTGIGGGGFLLFYTPDMKIPLTLDFREKAPSKAFKDMFLGKNGEARTEKSWNGIWSVAVPGMVAGMVEIHKKYGKIPFAELIRPAIQLAEKGLPVYSHLAFSIEEKKETLKKYKASRDIFFKDGAPLKEGDLLIQKDLAKTLTLIANHGKEGFYSGTVANLFINEQKRLGGLIDEEDLLHYLPIYRRPVEGEFNGYQIYSMAPPSSGGAHIIQILNMIDGEEELKKWGPADARTIHLLASSMQLAFADRAKYLGDPDFVEIPIKGITSPQYGKILRAKIMNNKASTQEEVYPGNPENYESEETTHFTIMDGKGNVITSTQTINGRLGSGIVVPETGIILNNEMDDFTTKVGEQNYFGAIGGYNNIIKGNKRPLSSMSPTLVMKNQIPILALGTPSGTKIISCITLTLLNYLKFELPLSEAVMGLRYHHQWYPNEIVIEENLLDEKTIKRLEEMGHKIEYQDLGCKVQAIAKEGPNLHGFSDLRGVGMSKGL